MRQDLIYVGTEAYFQNDKWWIDVYTGGEDGASNLVMVEVDLPEKSSKANPYLVRKIENYIKHALPANLDVKVSLYFWTHFAYSGQQREMDI